jgi:hypothetical protein
VLVPAREAEVVADVDVVVSNDVAVDELQACLASQGAQLS